MHPLFLTLFFSIFHAVGGLAFGRGLRTVGHDPQNSLNLVLLGGLFGLAPLVFDWFFFLREGEIILGLIGPSVFAATAVSGALVETGARANMAVRALVTTTLGSAAFVIGIYAAFVGLTSGRTLTIADWIFGSLLVLLFVLIGGGFAASGLRALFGGQTLDASVVDAQQE